MRTRKTRFGMLVIIFNVLVSVIFSTTLIKLNLKRKGFHDSRSHRETLLRSTGEKKAEFTF